MLCEKLSRIVVFVLALTVVVSLVVPATADIVIYGDAFNRIGSLDGSSPGTTLGAYGGTSGAAWVASANWTTDGSQANLSATESQAFLPFTPQSNNVYTLSVKMNCTGNRGTGNEGDWMSLGFSSGNTTSGTWNNNANTVSGWWLERSLAYGGGSGSAYTVPGPGTAGIAATTASGEHVFSVILDTTQSAWTSAFKLDGNPVGQAVAYGTNPTINYVGIGNDYGTGYVKSFQLSVAGVPEPSAVVLVTSGLFGLLAYAWRKRR